jgi:hypothetical protein
MKIGQLAIAEQLAEFQMTLRHNDLLVEVLASATGLDLPGWHLTSGCLFQTVWNVITDRPPTEGIRDYDLFYFDDTDLSWDAEDAVIKTGARIFAGLPAVVEIRNEARVHLWYEGHFGVPCAPYDSTVGHRLVRGDDVQSRRPSDGRRRLARLRAARLRGRVQHGGPPQPRSGATGGLRNEDAPVAGAMAGPDRVAVAARLTRNPGCPHPRRPSTASPAPALPGAGFRYVGIRVASPQGGRGLFGGGFENQGVGVAIW